MDSGWGFNGGLVGREVRTLDFEDFEVNEEEDTLTLILELLETIIGGCGGGGGNDGGLESLGGVAET